MKNILKIMSVVAGLACAQNAAASSLPAVTDNYEGTYFVRDTFTTSNHGSFTHGLYLPGFIGDASWSVVNGTAQYENDKLTLTGTVAKTVSTQYYSLDFDFTVHETGTAPNGLICGGGTGPGTCKSQQGGAGEANIVHFDMGTAATMGSLTGSGGNILDGLEISVEMMPLFGSGRKPGQLGYGGDWYTDQFGYSNWLNWAITSNDTDLWFNKTSGSGDVNFTLVATPLPAGLPLVLTGLAGFYALRRRRTPV